MLHCEAMRGLVLAVLVVPAMAAADCMDWSWKVFPAAGSTVPPNTRLVLQGHGLARPIVADLAQRNPRLAVGSHRVPLKVIATHVGEFQLTQVVLQPTSPLMPGAQYTLRFDERPGEVAFRLNRDEVARWTVAEESDFEAPVWRAAPVALAGVIKPMGCGPVVEARVRVALDDAGALVRARVTGADGKPREFLLAPRDGELAVGHGMCNGAFQLGEGEWELELTALDAAGNATPAPGPALRFKGVEPSPR